MAKKITVKLLHWAIITYMYLVNFSCFIAEEDECAKPDTCDQICTNTAGSYGCSCNAGYVLSSDKKTCSGLWCDKETCDFYFFKISLF